MSRFLVAALLAMPIGGLSAQAPVGIAVERRAAEALALRVGDTLRVAAEPGQAGIAAVVAAIYEPSADPAAVTHRDMRIRMHLPDLQALLGTPDRVDRIGVVLRPGVDPDGATDSLNQLAFGFRARPSAEIASGSSQTFRVVSRFHRAIAVISIVASAVFLLCIMLLKVEERRLDTAMMRFVGVRRRTVFRALLLEATAVAALGSAVGVLLALGAGALTNLYYQGFFDTTLVFSQITPGVLGFSVALSVGLGLAAGAIAAWRLVTASPMSLWGR